MRITRMRLKYPMWFGPGITSDLGSEHVFTEVTTGFYAGWIQVSEEKAPHIVTLVPPSNIAGVCGVYDGTVEVQFDTSDVTAVPVAVDVVQTKRGKKP